MEPDTISKIKSLPPLEIFFPFLQRQSLEEKERFEFLFENFCGILGPVYTIDEKGIHFKLVASKSLENRHDFSEACPIDTLLPFYLFPMTCNDQRDDLFYIFETKAKSDERVLVELMKFFVSSQITM